MPILPQKWPPELGIGRNGAVSGPKVAISALTAPLNTGGRRAPRLSTRSGSRSKQAPSHRSEAAPGGRNGKGPRSRPRKSLSQQRRTQQGIWSNEIHQREACPPRGSRSRRSASCPVIDHPPERPLSIFGIRAYECLAMHEKVNPTEALATTSIRSNVGHGRGQRHHRYPARPKDGRAEHRSRLTHETHATRY
jgi:hypothetical protein